MKLKEQKGCSIVFPSEKGTYIRPRNYERTFQKAIKKAGIEKCNVHTMRHSFATRLFEINVNPKAISSLLGHTDVSFTLNTYTHVLNNKKVEAVNALNRLYCKG
jgi:integrase